MAKETMTSRERVVRMLNHEPVDRYPIDLGCHPSTGISAFAYWHLREYLGLSTDDIWVPDAVQFLAYVDEDVMRRFHLDVMCLEPRWESEARWSPREPFAFAVPEQMHPELQADGSWLVGHGGNRMRMPAGGYFFDGAWLSDWSTGGEAAVLELYAKAAERIYKETPYAVNFTGYGRGMGFSAFFGGVERAVDMILDPERIMAENEAALQAAMARAGRIIDRMGQYIQLISLGDDMGLQAGPACRPSLMEQFVMPYLSRFCDFVHRNSDVKVFLHNCGSVRPLIGMLIDAGVDVLNPVQISAANMAPDDLAADFGGRITYWGGGCDTQRVLGLQTPDEVRDNARGLARVFKTTAGFVFNQVHNIMGDVPPENVVAMLDTAYEEAFYDGPWAE